MNVTAVSRNPGQLDLFMTGGDGHVYTTWWTAGSDWPGLKWRDIGGVFPPGAPVAAVSRNPNQLDIFVCGGDGRVYTSWWSAGADWSGLNNNWRNIGGVFPAGAPLAAVSRNPNQLDLFICGGDGRVYTSWWTAGFDWSGLNDNWRNIGGVFPAGAPLAAVSRNPNQLDLFICGNDGRVYTSWWTAGFDWSGLNDNWRNIGGVFPAGAPLASVSRNPNQLDVFICGNDGRVCTSWWTAGFDWSGLNDDWRNIGGVFPAGAPLAANSRNPNQLDLFICGNDGRVYTSWWTAGGDWTGLGDQWRNIGGVFAAGAPVAAVSRNPNQLDLFICGTDNLAYTSWWTFGSDWSGIGDRWRRIGGMLPTSLHFHADLTFSDSTPVGGWSDLVINQDGTYAFSGGLHDSGFPSYDVAMGWALQDAAGRVYTFADKGHVDGTDAGFSPNRDWNWSDSGSNANISSNWEQLIDCGWRWKVEANVDIAVLMGDLEKLYTTVQTIINVVGAVAA